MPPSIAQVGDIQGGAQRVHPVLLRLALVADGSDRDQGVFNLLERHQDGLLVLSQYLPCLGFCRALLESEAFRIEQRACQSKSSHAELTAGEQEI